MNKPRWTRIDGAGPLLAVANHNGHQLRPELLENCALAEEERFREEDPFTEFWTTVAPTRLIPDASRFEVDLNRARHEAFYREPKDAWGLNIWKQTPDDAMVQNSLNYYDEYYAEVGRICSDLEKKYGKFVVLDIHSYNHRRPGPDQPPEDPEKNPEVNLGTGTMDRKYWGPLVDRFTSDLRDFNFMGRSLDVRENIKFVGRQLPQWVHQNFPKTGCALALEFKKFFMDEWSGELFPDVQKAIHDALQATLPGLLEEIGKR